LSSKNPKTTSFRKLLDEESEKVTLLWVPGHMGIPGKEITDEEAKAALEDDLLAAEKYSPQDLINCENDMKNRKKEIEW
jgi:ribonuclease HI